MKISSVQALLAFSEAAKHGSFAAAARELSVSASAVAKSVQRLEQHLGLRLFHRTTRRVSLTQEGEALYDRCRRILDELGELETSAAGAASGPTGILRLDAPITWGKIVLIPVLARLAQDYPALGIDLRLSDRLTDLVGSGLDAVIRIGEIADSRLVARKIDEQRLGVYGAPGYLARRGKPRDPAALEEHDCVVFRLPATGRDRGWEFFADAGTVTLHPRRRYRVDEGEALVAAAIAGLGLIQAPHQMAEDALASGALIEVLARFQPPPMPISIVYPSNRQVPTRLRALIDALDARR